MELCHLHALPLLCSGALVSLGRNFLYLVWCPDLCDYYPEEYILTVWLWTSGSLSSWSMEL